MTRSIQTISRPETMDRPGVKLTYLEPANLPTSLVTEASRRLVEQAADEFLAEARRSIDRRQDELLADLAETVEAELACIAGIGLDDLDAIDILDPDDLPGWGTHLSAEDLQTMRVGRLYHYLP